MNFFLGQKRGGSLGSVLPPQPGLVNIDYYYFVKARYGVYVCIVCYLLRHIDFFLFLISYVYVHVGLYMYIYTYIYIYIYILYTYIYIHTHIYTYIDTHIEYVD